MSEVKLKTHLIVSDIHEEYFVDWCGSIAHTKPRIENGMPIFVIMTSRKRVELNTVNIKRVEECAKKLTEPHGRQAVTTDIAYIYIQENDGGRALIGTVTHNHVKQYQQMFDKFERI